MHSYSMLTAENVLSVLFLMLLCGTFCGKLAEKLQVPDVALYILIGLLIGPTGFAWIKISPESVLNQMILVFGASFILFHGGAVTRFSHLKQVWRSLISLSTLGVIVTAFVTACGISVLFGIPFAHSLLIGSILASTDPAALIPIFQKFPVNFKVSQTVIAESALTDATGAILTTVVFAFASSGAPFQLSSAIYQFIQLSVGGLLIGAVIGGIAAYLIAENGWGILREYTQMVVVLSVLGAYLAAEALHASGFMSVFAAGLMVGNASQLKLQVAADHERTANEFMDAVALKLRMLIFILLGSQLQFRDLVMYGLPALGVALIFIGVARPLTVLCSVTWDLRAKWKKNEVLFLFWTRETGVLAATLVGIVNASGLPFHEIRFAVTFLVILVTLVGQASTTPWLAKRLGLLEKDVRMNLDL